MSIINKTLFNVTLVYKSGLGAKCDVELFRFPAGEFGVRVPNLPDNLSDVATVRIQAFVFNGDIMALCQLKDCFDRAFLKLGVSPRYVLDLPYIPYARQDRVAADGDSCAITVFATILNSLKFDQVFTMDCHSAVSESVINNLLVTNPTKDDFPAIANAKNPVFIAPDAGAIKRTIRFSGVGVDDIRIGVKERDPKTGEINGLTVLGKPIPEDADIFVIDDICDGGYTFICLANGIKSIKYNSLNLIVTHGIYTKGKEVLHPMYDTVSEVYNYPEIFKRHQEQEGKDV